MVTVLPSMVVVVVEPLLELEDFETSVRDSLTLTGASGSAWSWSEEARTRLRNAVDFIFIGLGVWGQSK